MSMFKVLTFDSLGRNIFTDVDSTFSRITQANITTFFVGPKSWNLWNEGVNNEPGREPFSVPHGAVTGFLRNHPLGFNWHPLEGGGILYKYMYI